MDPALQSLLQRYTLQSPEDHENALKEIIQYLALLGLWRSKFFEHSAFYGGTALRIFYGLQRFSEDLDFSLLEPTPSFNLKPHLESIRKELESFGFEVEVAPKSKSRDSRIESAFIKGRTHKNLLVIQAPKNQIQQLPRGKLLKIKVELDTDPPTKAGYDVKTLLTPIPFQVRLFSAPDLFAGKIHAILCRPWKSRIKGRDFYDFLWYLGQDIPCHVEHLQERMRQTGHWSTEKVLDHRKLQELLKARFEKTDFAQAKKDVTPFLKDAQALVLWDSRFFIEMLKQLRSC